MPEASVIIPSLNRPGSLAKCLESLDKQTFKDYETIIVTEEGPLAKIRNLGASRASGRYLVFIDDDVRLGPQWLGEVVEGFKRTNDVAGVSGPAIIVEAFRRQRDLFSYGWAKRIYDNFFCNGRHLLPGTITEAGAWTTGACDEDCQYEGEVDFLEACNMAWDSQVFHQVGGFDEAFKGVGDWSEPDLAFRIRKTGKRLWFTKDARLFHEPTRTGVFKKRIGDSRNRMANYRLFAKRHIKPHWKHTLYLGFLYSYYTFAAIERRYIHNGRV